MLLSSRSLLTIKIVDWIATLLEATTIIVALSGRTTISDSPLSIEAIISVQIGELGKIFHQTGNFLVKYVVNLTMKLVTVLIAWTLTIMGSHPKLRWLPTPPTPLLHGLSTLEPLLI
ncbi:hypothetical protein ACFX2H_012129 [Malus domestica]